MMLATAMLSALLGNQHPMEPVSCLAVRDTATLAAQNDPRIQEAQADVALAEADFSDALALRRPQISAFARSSSGDTGLTTNQIENQVGLQVSQRLIDFGDARFARSQARNEVRASEYGVQVQQLSSAASAIIAHLQYVLAHEDRAVVDDQVVYFSNLLSRLERLLDDGASTRDAVAAVRSRLAAAQAEATSLELRAIEAEIEVSVLTGVNQTPCAQANESQLLSIALVDSTNAEQPQESPRILGLRSSVAAAEADVRRARRDRLPAIDLVAIGSYAYEDFRDEWEYRDRVGVDVSVPLYQGDMLRARVDRSRSQLARQESRLRLAERRLSQEIRAASSRIRTLRQLRQTRDEAAQTKRAELEALEIAFEGGQRTLFELLETQVGLAEAERSFNQVNYQLLTEYVRLSELTGRMDITLEDIDGAQRPKIWGWEPDPAD
ncbi:TolC family protein [Maricaulaceae bacterium EIL42A08]|nr:TolC family protein [Maricaulaceae bacterium EIL42A08]